MASLVGTFLNRNVIYVESFFSIPRAENTPVLWFAQFSGAPRPQRREAMGILTIGFCLGASASTTVPLRLYEESVPYAGSLGKLLFPQSLDGWFCLMFQPFESVVGQNFALIIAPD